MGYYVDLNAITLEDFFAKIADVSVLPSQRVLREAPEERLLRLKKIGIDNVNQLQMILRTKEKIKETSQKTGLAEDYLTLMRRELDRYQPKPISFKDIPELKGDVLGKLRLNRINTTLHLFDKVLTAEDRMETAHYLGISMEDVIELAKLTDVSRIMWSTPTFVRLLIEAGYDSVSKTSGADYRMMYADLKQVNDRKSYLKSRLSENDVRLFVRYACDVPEGIIW